MSTTAVSLEETVDLSAGIMFEFIIEYLIVMGQNVHLKGDWIRDESNRPRAG